MATDLTKIITLPTKKKTTIELSEQDYLKTRLVKEIDYFWSDYLEALAKIKELVKVKVYLPQDPSEAFFWETINLFKKGIQQLNKKLRSMVYQ